MEATIVQAPPSQLRQARWSTSVLFFLNGTIVATWATRLPAVQSNLGLSASQLGIALLGAAVGTLAAMNLSGYLSARFGSKPVTVTAALCLYVMLSLLALAPTLPILVGILVLFGASNGSMDVAMNAQGVSVERRYGRPILNSFHAFFSLGGLTGAVVGGLVAYKSVPAFEHFLGVAVVCAVVTAVVARFLLPGDAAAQKTSLEFVRPSRAILVLGLVVLRGSAVTRNTMLKEERHQAIMECLELKRKVVVTDLMTRFHVSEDTIRRDLDELASLGRLQRVHGGALPRALFSPFEERVQVASTTKRALAEAAAHFIQDGHVIVMDSGSSVLAVASSLPMNLRATIVTNSLPVASALVHHPQIEVLVLGGQLKKDTQAMVGIPVIEALQQVRADLCVLGVCSLHPEIGISMLDREEAHVKRTMIQRAAEVVTVADATKLGTAAPFVVGPINALTYLVTDRSIEPGKLEPYQAQGIAVIRAGSEKPTA
jgi:DeoR/GlpR family transcriptional regulator of sugar metabolism